MKNRIGFVPKSSQIQPDYYSLIFNGWTAVFIAEDNTEFHLSLIPDYSKVDCAKEIQVLKQGSSCRTPVRPGKITSIRQGLEIISDLLAKHKI